MYNLVETPHKDDGVFFYIIRWKQGENKTKQKYYTNFNPHFNNAFEKLTPELSKPFFI